MKNRYLLLILFSIFCFKGFSQAPGCPEVTVSSVAPLCNPGDCTNISANFFDTGETTSYAVSSVPYAPPYPFVGGTQVSANTDDVWSPQINLPFDFCFYGANYTSAWVGSNGVIGFNNPNGGGCPWAYSQTIPNVNFPIKNAIYGVYQDIDPSVNNSFADPNINYQVIGEYPCRTLVVNFSQVAQFGGTCNNNATVGAQTSQIVLYETTNVIEVYVERRQPCTAWQGGVGVIGVQNAAGTQGVAPPGRNTGAWSTTNEAWRFTPSGPSIVDFEWLLGNDVISTSTTLSVCPEETTAYTARATYNRCDGTTVVKTATALVQVSEPMEIGEAEDIIICDPEGAPYEFDLTQNTEAILNGMDPDLFPLTFFENEDFANAGFPTIITPGSYETDGELQTIYVKVEDFITGCDTITTFNIQAAPAPTAAAPPDLVVCDDESNDNFEIFDLTVQDGPVLAGQDPNLFIITYHTDFAEATANDDAITTPESFNGTNQPIYVRVTSIDNEDCYAINTFDLIINGQPVIEVPPPGYACDDEGYVLPILNIGNYFTQPGGAGTPLSAGDILFTSQTVYIYAESGTVPNCIDEESFEVTVYEKPEVDELADVSECDIYVLPELEEGNYYTEANGTGALLEPGTEITATQTLYIYANSGIEVECSDEHVFTVTINYAPEILPATPIAVCDDNFDGNAIFDLTPAGEEVTGNQPGFVVTYHETTDNLPGGTNAIEDPSNYLGITSTIYIRVVEEGTTTNCYSFVPLEISVNERPAIPEVSDYELCDDNNSPDGVEEFDLTTRDLEATFGENGVTVLYYETQADIIAENPIANPAAYSNTNSPDEQEIWVVTTTENGCQSTSSFMLIVNPLPVVNPELGTFFACEEIPGQGEFDLDAMVTEITDGASGYTVTYYATLAQAEGSNPDDALASPYTSPTGTIYAELTDVETGCTLITPVQLEVLPAPIAPEPAPLEECDDNNDGVAVFNLNPVLQQIQDALGDVIVTAHETYEDAFYDGVNAIPNTGSYTNIQANGNNIPTIYILVQSGQTECFDIVELQLIVHPVPEATTPEDYELCDSSPNDTDGIATFNLTLVDEEVLGDMDPLLFDVTYYESEAAAELGQGAIANPASYQSGTATVWVRVTNNETGCYDVVALELIVNPLPVANQPTPYTLCDEDNPGDETEEFDLTTKIPEIITVNGELQQGINVTFHDTFDEAVAGDNAIENPEAYQNSPAVETIFVRVTFEETGCFRVVLLDVRVEPLPVLYPEFVDPDDLQVCDEDGNGIGVFDLEAIVEDLVSNGLNLAVSFHETSQDAITGLNPITNLSSYQNDVPFEDVVYVRVANTVTGCVGVAPYALTLTVIPSPQVPDLADITICDDTDNNGQDNQANFDLTQQEDVIYAAAGIEEDYIVHYFINEDFAREGAPRITTPQNYYGTDGQVIWVRVEDPETGCFGITSFTLELNQPLAITTPSMLTLCETELPNDGFEVFDLTVKDNEILGPFGVGQDMVVEYYVSQDAVDAGTPITNPEAFTNTQNAQTLFVVVTTPEGCRSYTTLTIKVLPLPTPNTTPDALVLCDDNNSPDGIEEFDLTQAEDDIRDNDSTVVLSYFETQEDAENNENPIASPEAYSSATGSVWVRVEANTGNPNDEVCYQVVELQLIVNPLPVLGDQDGIAPFAICEQNTDGFAEFILNEHLPEILPGVAPEEYEDYTVRFFLSEANAAAGTPALPNQYTNAQQGQQEVWVRVTHDETGCVAIASFDLLVEEQAIANPVVDTDFIECDTDGDNDGLFTFDLTLVEGEVLGTQDPAIHDITYYTSLEDAENGENAIANPAAYQSEAANVQEIWVRIVNTSTVSGCPDFTSFFLYVENLPVPAIEGGTICVDFTSGDVLSTHTLDTGLSADDHSFVWYQDGEVIAGASGATYEVTEAGSYTVVATTILGGCVSEPVAPVSVVRSGPASPIGQGYAVTNAFTDNQVITVLVEGYGQYQYSLDFGPYQDSNVFTNVSPGVHTIHVKDVSTDNPCDEFVLDILEVSVIDYPKFFTPNGDGYNDTWNIIGLGDYPESRIYIFDRYGKLMKQLSPGADSEGWDGTYNGAPVPATDYWFTVTYPEDADGNGTMVTREFKAHFSLKR